MLWTMWCAIVCSSKARMMSSSDKQPTATATSICTTLTWHLDATTKLRNIGDGKNCICTLTSLLAVWKTEKFTSVWKASKITLAVWNPEKFTSVWNVSKITLRQSFFNSWNKRNTSNLMKYNLRFHQPKEFEGAPCARRWSGNFALVTQYLLQT